jgi:hypothetical protein
MVRVGEEGWCHGVCVRSLRPCCSGLQPLPQQCSGCRHTGRHTGRRANSGHRMVLTPVAIARLSHL